MTYGTTLRAALGAAFSLAALANAAEYPAPVAALQARGIEIVGRFDAPGGMSGFAALMESQPLSIYVTPDGKHAVVGPMVDAKGTDVSAAALDKVVARPAGEKHWKQLESSAWIADGSARAPRIVYTFTDPNCPYCNRFWRDARPWVDAGKVQLRHVIVGILGPTSAPKAAALLEAKDPAAELSRHARDHAKGGVKPAAQVSEAARGKLEANARLMQQLGSFATPTTFYRDASGIVRKVQGAPAPEVLTAILGPR